MSRHDGSYDHRFIVENPIPARCVKCRYEWVDGKPYRWVTPGGAVKQIICHDAIRAPTLERCRCFWCGGALTPLDPAAYAARLATLHLHRHPVQLRLI